MEVNLPLVAAAHRPSALPFGRFAKLSWHEEVDAVGKNNRQRRADKRRERSRARAGQGSYEGSHSDWSERPPIANSELGERDLAAMLIYEAAEASECGDEDRLEDALDALGGLGDRGRSAASAMGAAMATNLASALRAAWQGGWQPADIMKATEKRLGQSGMALARQLVAAEAQISAGPGVAVPETWAVQLQQVGPGDGWGALEGVDNYALIAGVALLGVLMYLPIQPHLLPPPSRWGKGPQVARHRVAPTGVDDRMLARVRALLAKAESTDFEEEANSLTAKAQELMTRHAIDQAMLTVDTADEAPCGRRIWIDDPYAGAKANLLAAVARANRCRAVWTESYAFSTLFGFSGDLDNVDVLYTSLLVQATRAMTAAGSVRDGDGRSRTRSFRQSFLLAFAGRIGERLRAATTAATEEAGAVHGGALLPVLAGRDSAVEEACTAAFPHLVPMNVRVSNRAGWVAGRLAADRAQLGYGQLLPGLAG
jgi:hypothetical protein